MVCFCCWNKAGFGPLSAQAGKDSHVLGTVHYHAGSLLFIVSSVSVMWGLMEQADTCKEGHQPGRADRVSRVDERVSFVHMFSTVPLILGAKETQ